MMYPMYSTSQMCGGTYSLYGKVCAWQVASKGDHVEVQLSGDDRHDGKVYSYPSRFDALCAIPDLIAGGLA